MDLNLEAKNAQETILKQYLEANASDELKMKIAISGKTLSNAWSYIYSQARKTLNGKSGCIQDEVVYGWLIHYFEDEINEEESTKPIEPKVATVSKSKQKATKPKEEPKTQVKMEVKKNEQTNKGYVQITLNDLFDL